MISFCFVPHHSSCVVAEQLFASFTCGGQGTVGRGKIELKPVFAIKPERPSFSPSSLISGTSAWGVLDYAVHTFLALRFFCK